MAANVTMLVLGMMALLLWTVRRQEVELAFLALSSVFWFLRNYQYFAEVTPFHLARWEVEPCATLPWLDATNALHVLRVFQEAIGNVLMHAGASEIAIGCRACVRDGIAGISAFVADNGHGMVPDEAARGGKGLANIRARALSLHGALDCTAAPGAGTRIVLWLPYERRSDAAA